jgi:hypothetical protein
MTLATCEHTGPCPASSGAHAASKSKSSASSGVSRLARGCGQSLPQTKRSGAAFTNARAVIVADADVGSSERKNTPAVCAARHMAVASESEQRSPSGEDVKGCNKNGSTQDRPHDREGPTADAYDEWLRQVELMGKPRSEQCSNETERS